MANDYYTHGAYPGTGALGASSAMRSELELVTAGFAKLPGLAGNGDKIIGVASDASGLTALTTTGTGSAVRATSPTLVTPILGTPTSGNLVNCTGYALSGLSGAGAGVLTFLATPSSANLAAALTDETGSGAVVFGTSPTITSANLVTPALGVATATTINKVTITTPASGSTLTIADGKTLTASNTLTFTGTDTSSVAFGTGGTVAYTANNLSVFAATTSAQLKGVLSDETGSGAAVFANTPSLVTPILDTPQSGTLTNCTGLPVSTGISGLGTGVAAFLAAPSSANLLSALTTKQGTGLAVFDGSPTLTTPNIGVATATTVNKVTITAPASSATLTITDGKTAAFSNSITFAGTDGTTMTFPSASASVGYLGRPQNSQSVDYTLVLADSDKQMYQTAAGVKTWTIPANASVAYPIGTELVFINGGGSNNTIAITSDTLTLANSASTGTRTLATKGVATARKVTSTSWIIDGTGLT